MKIRISLVDYLNSAPLGWYFLHGPDRSEFEVIPSSPARCADQLARGEVDIGLIPSIEYQNIPDLTILPGVSISASREVRSVLMVRPEGDEPIRSVALDTSSRTSVALLKILLWSKYRLTPEFVPHPPDLPEMLSRCDAALLIGDAALKLSTENYRIMDLAAEWIAWQGRPFVFAFWACRRDFDPDVDVAKAFLDAKFWGLRVRDEIARIYAERLGLPASFLRSYLHENIDFDMGDEHVSGLEKFYAMAAESGLITRVEPVRFRPLKVEAETLA